MSSNAKFKETGLGKFPEDWKILTLEEATEEIIDYRGKTPKKTTSGVPLITAKIVKNGHIVEPDEFISESDYEDWMRRGMPQCGDVIITTEAPMGEVAQLDERKVALAQRLITLRGKKNLLNNNFLRFVLQSSILQNELRKRESGTTVTGIKQSELRKVLLPIPPYPEQKAISDVLLSLDDKITLNRSMNSTLEAIGQALFRRWFVDFEFPNEEGKPYRSSGGEMVETELGEVLRGWRVGTLGNIAENLRHGIQPEDIDPDTSYIGLEHMPRRNIALTDWDYAKNIDSNKFEFHKGDILFGKLRPYFHKVGIAAVDGVCSTDILVIVPKLPIWYGLVLFHFSSVELVNHADATSTGTRMPRANWNNIAQFQIMLPPNDIAQKFTKNILPLTQKIQENIIQSRTLAELRDALLPKLMSGEIRVGVNDF